MNKQEKILFEQFKKAQPKPEQPKPLPDFPELPTASESVREVNKLEKLGFWNKSKLRRKPDKSFLITFFFSNGTSRTFVIATREETFDYKGRTYYLKYDEAWFDLSHKQYRLLYFDDFAVPINRMIQKIGDKAFFAVTPENLKPLIKQEYVKALAQSHELSRYLKFSLLLAIVNGLISLVTVLMIYNALYR